jgi:uncharacterized damage-inducible protein DinB
VQWPAPPRQPLAWYLEQHDRIRARTHEILADFNDPAQEFQRKNDRVTLRWLLHHVIGHEAYHAGQVLLLALQYLAITRQAG